MAVQYSIQKMVSDGTLSTIVLGIQYLQRNDIYMRIAWVDTPQSGATSGYTWSFVNNTTLKILPVVPNGVEVVVYRRTDVDEMYNIYSQNAQFDEATIDENNRQLLYIAQEYLEQGIPGAGVDTLEFLRDDGTNTYYRIKRTDGSYSEEFAVPSAGRATKILAREALCRSYADAGYTLVAGSFKAGFTLVDANDVALDDGTGKCFSGAAGTYPSGTSTAGFVDVSRAIASAVLGNISESKCPAGTEVVTKKIDRTFRYSIIPNSGSLGDGDIVIDRVDGAQAQMSIDGAIDVKAFYRHGRTDQQTIQAALDYAGSKAGNWVVAVTPKADGTAWGFDELHIGSSTVFQGHGGQLRLNDGVCSNSSASYYPINNLNEDNTWIDGIYADGNMANNGQFVVADLVTLSGNLSKISDSWLLNAPDSGLMFSSVIAGSAIGNHIVGGRDCGIYANASSDGGSRGTVISSNVISNFDSTGIGFKRYFADCEADGNIIQLCGNGVTFEDFGGSSYPKRINMNGLSMRDIGYVKRATGIAERGISVSRGAEITISDFQARNVSGDVLYLGNVSGSTFSKGTLRGYVASPHPAGNNGVRVIAAVDSDILDMNITGVFDRAGYFSNMQRCSISGGHYVSSGSKAGIRVDANCDLYDFSPSRIHGGSGTDLEWFEGAKGRAEGYRLTNASGPAAYGFVVVSAGTSTTPVGYITPRFIGQRVFAAFDSSWWMSVGLTNADWKKLT